MSRSEVMAMNQTHDPLQSRPLLRFARRAVYNWRERHQHPFSFWIHMIGIPMTVVGIALLFFVPWYWGVGAFVLGYLLQFIGHCVEGNDMGEWAGIKRLFGLPYVAISPRWQKKDGDRGASATGGNYSGR